MPQNDPRTLMLFCSFAGGNVGITGAVGDAVGSGDIVGDDVGGLVCPTAVGPALSVGLPLGIMLLFTVGNALALGTMLGIMLGG